MRRILMLALGLLALTGLLSPAAGAQTGPVTPYPDAPACPAHDPLAWHGLWDATRGCHYNHHHGDDPRTVDGIFGMDWLNVTGGEMQMWWQPAGVNPVDTARKHNALFWLVRSGEPCVSQFGTGCITDFRAQVHALPSPVDQYRLDPATGQMGGSFHVARIEARVCLLSDPNACGIVRLAGRQYLGDVLVDGQVLWNFPDPRELFNSRTPRPVSLNYWSLGQRSFSTWYPVMPSGLLRIAVEFGDVWSAVNPADPTAVELLGGANNASNLQPHVIGIDIAARHVARLDPDQDGLVDYQGYVDVNGFFQDGCPAAGPNCIPVSYESVPIPPAQSGRSGYQYRGVAREYDVLFNRSSSGWLIYPDSSVP